ncbi:MAG: hypothetical protein ACI8X5_000870 [Planctomycetota bacterium]|jgi:hypothetical protein
MTHEEAIGVGRSPATRSSVSPITFSIIVKNQLVPIGMALCISAVSAQSVPSKSQSIDEARLSRQSEGVIRVEKYGQLMTTNRRGASRSQVEHVDSGRSGTQLPARHTAVPTGSAALGAEPCEVINRRNAGSLLLFPEYDNREAAQTIFTVTNTHDSQAVNVEYVYIGRYGPSLPEDIDNGDFDGGGGWTIDVSAPSGGPAGSVTFDSGRACFLEKYSLLTTLSQTFVMPEGASTLEFDLTLDPGFDLSGGFIPDAFEAQLLNGALMSVVPTWSAGASSCFNLQENLTSNLGGGTSYSGGHVVVDVSGVPVGESVTLYFDLIGPDSDHESGVKVSNVHLYAANPTDLGCAEFNRTEYLTPGDTLTVFTSSHNPNQSQGYAYVFAKNAGGDAIAFNSLIGSSMTSNALDQVDYSINAVAYQSPRAEGEATDSDNDGIRDLNGIEYDQTAAELLIPRFLGQGEVLEGHLILIALSGGAAFDTTLNFLAYNDNEEVFSTEYQFRCWDRVALANISGVFENEFLSLFTNDDPTESLGLIESGWIRISGAVATSTSHSIQFPAFYAVYVEDLDGSTGADLPFESCLTSAHLLPRGVHGDNEE